MRVPTITAPADVQRIVRGVPRWYLLAIVRALHGLDVEKAREAIDQVRYLLRPIPQIGDAEAEDGERAQQSGTRAIVSDDGSTIQLVSYTQDGTAVPVALSPVRAIAIAGELIRVALPKLGAAGQPALQSVPEEKGFKRRGGDPHAEQRRELHDGLRRMASLLGLGNGRSMAEVARELQGLRPVLARL